MEKRLDGRWWDETWNPITGCTPVSEGCRNCYAARMAKRLAGRYGYPESPHEFSVTSHPDKLEQPLRWRKPRVVFVCSMGDLFHEAIDVGDMVAIWKVMVEADQHVYLLLTKRPAEMVKFAYYLAKWMNWKVWPDHIWLGVSVENQDTMWRVGELLKIPAAHHFVNFGPLLGPIDFRERKPPCSHKGCYHHVTHPCEGCGRTQGFIPFHLLDGVAVEGESGPGARPMHPNWARGIRDQCAEAGVPFTFKQWGHFLHKSIAEVQHPGWHRWPGEDYLDVGKKAAGRELDGKPHDAWPWDVIGGMGGSG